MLDGTIDTTKNGQPLLPLILSASNRRAHLLNTYGAIGTGSEGENVAAIEDDNPEFASGGDDDNDIDGNNGSVEDDADDAVKNEENEISANEREASTAMAGLDEGKGPHGQCFGKMDDFERDGLKEKKDTLRIAEMAGGPQHDLNVRNAQLDVAIAKAEIIANHTTSESEAREARGVADNARREQAMLGDVQLKMTGKSPAEQQAMARDALDVKPSAPAPAATDLGQPGGLQSTWQRSLDRVLPIISEATPAAVFAPAAPAAPSFSVGPGR